MVAKIVKLKGSHTVACGVFSFAGWISVDDTFWSVDMSSRSRLRKGKTYVMPMVDLVADNILDGKSRENSDELHR